MKSNAMRSIAFSVVCMILGILIALQMKNVNSNNLSESNLADLQNKIIDFSRKNTELADRNAELIQYIGILENDMSSGNEQVESIIREKERAAIFAGLREVRNYGIRVQISCAEGVMVRDSVLRQYVNELRALGAQAISINDERLVAMSEIRASGDVIMINSVPYSRVGAFEIKAIVDPEKESYILSFLESLKKTIVNDPQFSGDQYNILLEPVPELTIPALSEDSIAFKINLLVTAEE